MQFRCTISGPPEIVGNTPAGGPETVVQRESHTNEVVTKNIYKGVKVHESTRDSYVQAPGIGHGGFRLAEPEGR